jgi:maleylacetate reductase
VLLPYTAAFNLPAAPTAEQALCRALHTDDVPRRLAHMSAALGAPRTLADLGLSTGDLRRVVEQVLAAPYANPRPVTGDALHALLTDVLKGALAP